MYKYRESIAQQYTYKIVLCLLNKKCSNSADIIALPDIFLGTTPVAFLGFHFSLPGHCICFFTSTIKRYVQKSTSCDALCSKVSILCMLYKGKVNFLKTWKYNYSFENT